MDGNRGIHRLHALCPDPAVDLPDLLVCVFFIFPFRNKFWIIRLKNIHWKTGSLILFTSADERKVCHTPVLIYTVFSGNAEGGDVPYLSGSCVDLDFLVRLCPENYRQRRREKTERKCFMILYHYLETGFFDKSPMLKMILLRPLLPWKFVLFYPGHVNSGTGKCLIWALRSKIVIFVICGALPTGSGCRIH